MSYSREDDSGLQVMKYLTYILIGNE